MKLGFWKLKVTADIGNKGTDPYGMLNQSDQPTQFGHFSHLIPLIKNQVTNSHRRSV
jgi:hypothetical protein